MLTHAKPQSRHNVNLWVIPLQMAVGAIVLFAVTVTLDMLAAYHKIQIPNWFTMGGIDDARAILGAMLGCVSTVLALIFSVTLLVLSMVANLFGPRLLYRFVQDWVTQVCIGLFMAAFIYVFLVFLVTHQDEHTRFVPQVSLITSWFVVLAAFAFLVFYSHRVAVLIQNPDAIGRIVDDLAVVVERAYYAEGEGDEALQEADAVRVAGHEADCVVVRSEVSGYLQQVDEDRLVRAAAERGGLIVLPFRPGQFVLEGDVLATVSPAAAGVEVGRVVLGAVSLGRHRVLAQDVEFGLAQIVEIAIRALSPAINDTFTGVACVDLLGEAMVRIVEKPHRYGRMYDEAGVLRVQMRALLVPRLIKQAFDQVRQAGADNPAVSIRLLSVMGRLGGRMRKEEDRLALLEAVDAVWETVEAKGPVRMDREDLFAAWQTARGLLGAEVGTGTRAPG